MANARTKHYRTHIAIAFCKKCNDVMFSSGGGKFVTCYCKESYIDQERFSGLYVRVGGHAELIEQICPFDCKQKEHGRKK
jgi:hypothetical protein